MFSSTRMKDGRLSWYSKCSARGRNCFSEGSFSSVLSRSRRTRIPRINGACSWPPLLFSVSLVSPCLHASLSLSYPSVRPSRPRSLHLLRYAVPTTRPTRSCRSSSSGCGTRWLTWRAVCCPRPCCSTGAGWAQRTFWYPSFKSRSSLFVSLLVWPSTGGTNPVSNLLLVWILCVEQ